MFDEIAHKYDFMNNIISFGLHKIIKKDAINNLEINNGAKALDLCCGSGDVSKYLSKNKNVVQVYGIDYADNMLKIAVKNNKNEKIIYKNADCINLPFEDESFDVCTISFGFRNIKDKEKCIKEISRVLKKDGQFLHLDFVKNKNIIMKLYKIYVLIITSFLKDNSAYLYLLNSIDAYFTAEELGEIFEKNNLKLKKMKKYVFGNIVMLIFEKK